MNASGVSKYLSLSLMAVAIVAEKYADALPAYSIWMTDTASAALALAALFTKPPSPEGAAKSQEAAK